MTEKEHQESEEANDEAIKYLTIGGSLAGCLILSMLLCTIFNFFQRRQKTSLQNNPNIQEIQDKYNDTAVSNHQSFSDLDTAARIVSAARSSQSFTKEMTHFEMSLLAPGSQPVKNSISDSMFSSGHNSADLNSLGHEEYNDEPSRSWRRSRRSEESFI